LPPYPEPNDQISRVSGKWQMYLFWALQGQGTSAPGPVSGAPTECRPRTNSPSAPSASSTFVPTRVMMCMLATT